MEFKRGRYPDDSPKYSSPSWTLTGKWLYADADWNTHWPFGVCLCIRIGPKRPWPRPDSKYRQARRGFTLDLNAPLGEPNRLYVWGARREYMIGLFTWHDLHEDPDGVWRSVRCWPRLERGQGWDKKGGRARDFRDPAAWKWWVVKPAGRRDAGGA